MKCILSTIVFGLGATFIILFIYCCFEINNLEIEARQEAKKLEKKLNKLKKHKTIIIKSKLK